MTLSELIWVARSSDPDPEDRVKQIYTWEREEVAARFKEVVTFLVTLLVTLFSELYLESGLDGINPIVSLALLSLFGLLVLRSLQLRTLRRDYVAASALTSHLRSYFRAVEEAPSR